MEDTVKSGQIYKHYKGDTYKVLTLAKHSETGEWMVIYERLTNIIHQGWKIYARPLDMFIENVDVEGYNGPRFTLIEE